MDYLLESLLLAESMTMRLSLRDKIRLKQGSSPHRAKWQLVIPLYRARERTVWGQHGGSACGNAPWPSPTSLYIPSTTALIESYALYRLHVVFPGLEYKRSLCPSYNAATHAWNLDNGSAGVFQFIFFLLP
jgi:hypothetical protein